MHGRRHECISKLNNVFEGNIYLGNRVNIAFFVFYLIRALPQG